MGGDILKRINVLSESTSNQIAAGEVVERPFSVVKEIVENSIDADAKNITIEIAEGGQKKIKVTDDGMGIHPDDISKAFLPHATSKIKNIEDIFNVNSMGFRGEALPSIASVSNTILKSRVSGFDYGKEISISGGNVNYIKDTGSNVGTIVEVNDLFFNVPARQKFLKSSQRESALINDIICRLALAHNDISFKFVSNGKNLITTYASSNLKDIIRLVYDKNTCDNVISFEEHGDVLSVYGYIGSEEISRGSRNCQSIYVNKRYIKSKLITTAVENAFKSFLTINKFPFFILFLDIYPEMIDVNVHPTKSEIKFKDDRIIFKTVFDTVHAALRDSRLNSFRQEIQQSINLNVEEEKHDSVLVQLPIDLKSDNYDKPVLIQTEVKEVPKQYKTESLPKCEPMERIPKLPNLKIIGQFHNTYVVAEAGDELYLIDQHAAHEKILFEDYINKIKNMEVISQLLITPVVLELPPEDFATYIENKDIFKNTGFDIEVFGDNTISIREVPMILGKPDLKNLLNSILDNIKNMGTGLTTEVKYNKIATLACKAAVKGNNELTRAEMAALIEDMKYINDPFNCPHGRPTIIKMSLYEIEKKFKRIQ